MNVSRLVKTLLALILIIAGIIITPMPLPIGVVLVVAGISLLATTSTRVTNAIRQWRSRHQSTSNKMHKAKQYLPSFAKKVVDDTEPQKSQAKSKK